MTRAVAASVMLAVAAGTAPAQWVGGPGGHGRPPRVVGYRVAGVVGGPPVFPAFLPSPGYGFGPGWGFAPPYAIPFGPYGWNPYFLQPEPPIAPPIVLVGFGGQDQGAKDADFTVIGPKDPPFRVADRPPPKIDPPKPFVPPPAAREEKPEADPFAEAARQVGLARAAFAADRFGQAAEHLGRAVEARPDDALPYFLKAQAEFAGGRYADAVTTIRAGMKRSPDWPASGFKPRAFYGDRPERFDAHLAELRKVAEANPGEPAVQFLLAYQLWFAGDRDEAAGLFRRLADRVTDAAEAERFVREAGR